MRVKKFEAKTMKDALKMVKSELGPEAVILGARENKRTFGLGGDVSFEVTAAVSEPTLQKKRFLESRLKVQDRERFNTANARHQRQMIEKMVEKRLRTEERQQAQATFERRMSTEGRVPSQRSITKISYIDIPDEPSFSERAVQTTYVPRRRDVNHDVNVDGVMRAASAPADSDISRVSEAAGRIRSLAREAFAAGLTVTGGGREPHDQNEIDTLKNEINRLQNLIEGFQKIPQTFQGAAHPGAEFGLSYDFSHTFQKLVDTGVAKDLAAEVLHRAAKEIDPMNAKKPAIVEAWVAKWFLTHINVVQRPLANRFHLFVGPVGSGKTSQLVKLAAQLVLRERKRIAIVTTDTAKVGAVDQLKIYCQILNIPLAIVRDRSEWSTLEQQMGAIDHVLIDYPGASLSDIDEIQGIRSLIPEFTNMATHLCLSASMRDADAIDIVRRFKALQPTDLVFTGLDMSVQHGIIATVQLRSGLPLHSFGTGPHVPEDFECATKERVLDLLFKLSNIRKTMEK